MSFNTPSFKKKDGGGGEGGGSGGGGDELTGPFAQPVWITASPLTCSDLVEPEQRSEK